MSHGHSKVARKRDGIGACGCKLMESNHLVTCNSPPGIGDDSEPSDDPNISVRYRLRSRIAIQEARYHESKWVKIRLFTRDAQTPSCTIHDGVGLILFRRTTRGSRATFSLDA
jgi:hypothetical protein